jgi:hypothetical protein
MNNDKAQELTAKITKSINALCAETDAPKQSATYRVAFHSEPFSQLFVGNCLLIWTRRTVT